MGEHPQAKEIRLYRRIVGILSFAASILLTLWLLDGQPFGYGRAVRLAVEISLFTDNLWLQALMYAGGLYALFFAIGFPFQFVSSYVISHHYGLSTQSLDDWFADLFKGLLLGACLGSIVITGLTALLVFTGSNWWWLAAIAGTVFSILLTRLAPQILIPIFFKMKPLEQPELQSRFHALANKSNTPVLGIFEINLSRKTTAANAAVVGFGGSRRALVGDTLLEKFTDDEIEFVLAHELAHHKHHDLWRGIAAGATGLFINLGIVHWILTHWAPSLNLPFPFAIDAPFQPVILFWIAVLLSIISAAISPFERLLSRIMETRADAFAVQATGKAEAGINAFSRLGHQNRAVFNPPRWEEALFYTHPCIQRRIERISRSSAQKPTESMSR